MTQWARGFVIKNASASTYIIYLVIQGAFSETQEHNYFPDPPNGAARVIVLGAWCLLPRHDNDPDGKSPNSASVTGGSLLIKGLWLAVDKVIHHDDVLLLIIIRPRGDVAGRDPHPRDARVVKHDAEEGKAPIARRGRDETAEHQLAVGVEVLDQRAGPTVSLLLARPAPIRLVNVCEDRAEATDRCWVTLHWCRARRTKLR